MQLILNGDTRPILFFLAASSDHVTGLTGATATVTISKNGGTFAAPAGGVSEVGVGWYKLTPSGADSTTNGALVLHATATGADPADVKCQVVAFSPYDAVHLGLSALPNVAAGANGGLPIGDASGKVGLSQSTHGVPANGATTADPEQLIWAIYDMLANATQSGTTITAYGPDGVTAVMTFTLDNATTPLSRKRSG